MRVRVPPPALDSRSSIDTIPSAALGIVMGRSSPGHSEKFDLAWAKGLTAATDERVRRMALSKTGKPNWARGLTAATDSRIAKQAATRRGRPRGPYKPRADATARFDPFNYLETRRAEYAYLLGLYLGDGAIVTKTNRLEISLDARYPAVVRSCRLAMQRLHPRGRVAIRRKGYGCRVVSSYAWEWIELFPQHGVGHKHLRPIRLTEWQMKIEAEHPFDLLRGLIDSDGSRFDRKVDGRIYPAYEFSNESADIREIFCRVAGAVGLDFTVPKPNVVSVARRQHVATLDLHVPPKGRESQVVD
jgi:hypothetical protein